MEKWRKNKTPILQMAIERNYFITMPHQAGVHFENFTEVKFRDILLTGTGHWDRRLNRDSPGQTGTYGRSSYKGLELRSTYRRVSKLWTIVTFLQLILFLNAVAFFCFLLEGSPVDQTHRKSGWSKVRLCDNINDPTWSHHGLDQWRNQKFEPAGRKLS